MHTDYIYLSFFVSGWKPERFLFVRASARPQAFSRVQRLLPSVPDIGAPG